MKQKIKTRRGAAKRFKITANGKVKFKHAYLRHKLKNKKESTKRHLKKHAILHKDNIKQVKKLLPNSF